MGASRKGRGCGRAWDIIIGVIETRRGFSTIDDRAKKVGKKCRRQRERERESAREQRVLSTDIGDVHVSLSDVAAKA